MCQLEEGCPLVFIHAHLFTSNIACKQMKLTLNIFNFQKTENRFGTHFLLVYQHLAKFIVTNTLHIIILFLQNMRVLGRVLGQGTFK